VDVSLGEGSFFEEVSATREEDEVEEDATQDDYADGFAGGRVR
jgi:hypothetical protein